jgi:hypothetical protein
MPGLRSNMSGLGRICLVWGPTMSGQTGSHTTIGLREIKGTTKSNLNTRNHT